MADEIIVLNERLDLLDEDFQAFVGSHNPPSEAMIVDVERLLGVHFPAQYRAFLTEWGAMELEVKEDVWPRPKPFDVGPAWSFDYGFLILGIGSDIPEHLDVASVTEELRREMGLAPGIVPFLRWVGEGDYYCFDRNENVCYWSAEEGTCEIQQTNFIKTVIRYIDELSANKGKVQKQEP